MTTTVLDSAALAAAAMDSAAGSTPATCRIGLLGLGNVGGAFARHAREAGSHLSARGFAPVISTALVRTTSRPRAAAAFVTSITNDVEAFFAEPVDVIVEALGGVEPAFSLVRRGLDRGIGHATGVRRPWDCGVACCNVPPDCATRGDQRVGLTTRASRTPSCAREESLGGELRLRRLYPCPVVPCSRPRKAGRPPPATAAAGSAQVRSGDLGLRVAAAA